MSNQTAASPTQPSSETVKKPHRTRGGALAIDVNSIPPGYLRWAAAALGIVFTVFEEALRQPSPYPPWVNEALEKAKAKQMQDGPGGTPPSEAPAPPSTHSPTDPLPKPPNWSQDEWNKLMKDYIIGRLLDEWGKKQDQDREKQWQDIKKKIDQRVRELEQEKAAREKSGQSGSDKNQQGMFSKQIDAYRNFIHQTARNARETAVKGPFSSRTAVERTLRPSEKPATSNKGTGNFSVGKSLRNNALGGANANPSKKGSTTTPPFSTRKSLRESLM